jgi:hypothetical protein
VYRTTIIECASTYPSRQIRLYHKDAIRGWIKPIHERVELKQGFSAEIFPAPLYTPTPPTVRELKEKWRGYIALECARKRDYTLRMWLRHLVREGGVAGLMMFRLLRVRLLCRGTKLPLAHELMRQWYQWKLLSTLMRRISRF